MIGRSDSDLALDAAVYFLVGVVPQELRLLLTDEKEVAAVVDWQRTSPLLKHVQLAETVVLDAPVVEAGVNESDFEQLGFEVLIWGQRGPLVLVRRDGAKVFYYCLFDTDRSLITYSVGFPIMVLNLVNHTIYLRGLAEAHGPRTGVLPTLTVAADATFVVLGPKGSTRTVPSGPDGTLSGIPALRVGTYKVRQGAVEVARVGASLLDEAETRLDGVDEMRFNELPVTASDRVLEVDRSFWPILAPLAMFVLVLEWWFFQKRPGGWRQP